MNPGGVGAWLRPRGDPAVNADTGEALATELTSRRTADCARVPEFLDQIKDRVVTFRVDGASDTGAVCEAVQGKGDGQPGTSFPMVIGRSSRDGRMGLRARVFRP